jgi:Helix-turn-helix.
LNRITEILEENKREHRKPWSQRQLEDICGVPQPEISRIANEKVKDIELKTAAKIARGLGKSIEYVFPDY